MNVTWKDDDAVIAVRYRITPEGGETVEVEGAPNAPMPYELVPGCRYTIRATGLLRSEESPWDATHEFIIAEEQS